MSLLIFGCDILACTLSSLAFSEIVSSWGILLDGSHPDGLVTVTAFGIYDSNGAVTPIFELVYAVCT